MFQEDWAEFNKDIIKKVSLAALRDLRTTLLLKGVFVNKARGSTSFSKVLYNAAAEPPPDQTKDRKEERERLLVEYNAEKVEREKEREDRKETLRIAELAESKRKGKRGRGRGRGGGGGSNNNSSESSQSRSRSRRYRLHKLDNGSREISTLIKVYIDKDIKFRGDMYNVLNNKLYIFYDNC